MDSLDTRNVLDYYKGWPTEDIKEACKKDSLPYAVLMQHLTGDFNISSVWRSAYFFGAKEMFYFGGKRKIDPRGGVGVKFYHDITHLRTMEELVSLKSKYSFVGLENNTERHSIDIRDFSWPNNPLILIGEERQGLLPEVLSLCDYLIEIPNFSSMRSINAACAASIACMDFVNKWSR